MNEGWTQRSEKTTALGISHSKSSGGTFLQGGLNRTPNEKPKAEVSLWMKGRLEVLEKTTDDSLQTKGEPAMLGKSPVGCSNV